MLQLALTTARCRKIITVVLREPHWTIARIARVVGAPTEYAERIQAGKQSFQVTDVELLAKAVGWEVYELMFNSMEREKMSGSGRQLYDMASEQIQLYRQFKKSLAPKPAKRRRAKIVAA